MGNTQQTKESSSRFYVDVSDDSSEQQVEDVQEGGKSGRRPPPPPPKEEPYIVRALYDFGGMRDDDLAFKKGDRMKVDQSDMSGDWWIATHLVTKVTGCIPRNYVSNDDNSPEAQDWWFDLDRKGAEKMLLLAGNKTGTFIVRKATDGTSFVLSVRAHHADRDEPVVWHYRVRTTDSSEFYIISQRRFSTIIALVEHYRGGADGLCCQLTDACPRLLPVRHFQELEVKRDSVQLLHMLGAGCFGEVFLGTLFKKVDVAVKILKPGTMTPEAFLQEAKVMNQLRHPKLVQLLAVCTTSEPFLIVSELCVKGALLDYLRQDRGQLVKLPVMVAMAAQIADGMAYLEKENFVHRDLRAANILVGEHYEIKVADFGLAKLVDDDESKDLAGSKYPIKWTAPEAVHSQQFTSKSDVWSFGVVLYEIITYGAKPYPGMTNKEVMMRVARPELYRMAKPRGPVACPDCYFSLMQQCWRDQPQDRPTFAHLRDVFDDYFVTMETQHGSADAS